MITLRRPVCARLAAPKELQSWDVGIAPPLADRLTLESRYAEFDRPVLLSGVQALVRVLLEQSRLDKAAGLNTGGLVSGYRGSPLGGVDQELWRRESLLTAAGVRFQPGLNEDLAATMIWGAQQIDTFPGKRVDGVFGMWYGKGPGLDRSGDALRCANTIGTARHGGVLAVSGDDHAAHSSVFPHSTDGIFQSVHIPVLVPADVQDIVDFGLAGIALSRFCGLWVGLKTIAETAEQHGLATVPSTPSVRSRRLTLSCRRTASTLTRRSPGPLSGRSLSGDCCRSGFRPCWRGRGRTVLTGRPAAPARPRSASSLSARRTTMRCTRCGAWGWPSIRASRSIRWGWRGRWRRRRPAPSPAASGCCWWSRRSARWSRCNFATRCTTSPPIPGLPSSASGTPHGAELLPAVMELSPELLMRALSRTLPGHGIEVSAVELPAYQTEPGVMARAPMFCAGCPHNTSTTLPEGAHAMAGIGCHTIAVSTSDSTRTFSQMGGEGAPWVGLEHFTDMPHMFANMGDGTYQHSGLLAIRQAVAAKSRITYKLLYNDAVAMTGGQPAEGGPAVLSIARQLHAEGVGLLAIVADDPARLPSPADLPPGTLRHGREELDAVQRRMQAFEGVSAIIYDQVCATEKRRRRKRGKMAPAETHVSINARVCENCGDCTAQSNCIAIEPVETDYGRKRRISPTSCNTDLSCLKGFCPSFVTSSGAAPVEDHASRWAAAEAGLAAGLSEPALPTLTVPWRGLFAGIGGGGIVTCGAIVAMAAHLEGRAVSTLDFTGLAQKNGAVVSHVQVGQDGALDVVRIPSREADLLLGADLAVSAGADVLGRCREDAAVIGNLDLQGGAGFLQERGPQDRRGAAPPGH